MKKIPSLFKRDYEGTRQVYNEVVPGSEWVLGGEGVPTIKIDGTSCMIFEGQLFKRYDRKVNKKTGEYKEAPEGWSAAEEDPDPVTGHWPGWLPVGDGPEDKYHREAFYRHPNESGRRIYPAKKMTTMGDIDGTYELVGPKIQKNPYGMTRHELIGHGFVELLGEDPRTFEEVKEWMMDNYEEGIVWHHPDGRMVKIKRKDFGFDWP